MTPVTRVQLLPAEAEGHIVYGFSSIDSMCYFSVFCLFVLFLRAWEHGSVMVHVPTMYKMGFHIQQYKKGGRKRERREEKGEREGKN